MHFEKQEYQEKCVQNIVQVLEACDVRNNDFSNLPKAISALWQKESYTQFSIKDDKKRLDILMETGTGKTFTYLKTIFEIHKNFDKKKFIIVVPRTAIKLGVIQNIKLTKDYFYGEYKKYLKYIDYPKDGLSKITHDFLKTDDLCILITTNAAFNSDKNKINQKTETLFESGSCWEGIKKQKPMIIIDEPHLLKGTETQKGLDKLNNSLQIRFGATFPTDKKDEMHHLSNVVYSLDSISAFRKYLVKQITVDTLISEEEQGGLKLSFTESNKKAFMVVYDINKVVFRKRIRLGEDIGTKTGLEKFKNIKAVKITKDNVFLDNETILKLSKGKYELGDEEIRGMIQTTIEKHFEKEERLFNQNIKALSLFFIPSIADFRENEKNPKPRIKKIFEEEYKKQRTTILAETKNEHYKEYLKKDFKDGKLQVHEGYFSGDKVSTKDRKAGLNKDDLGVNMILNEKQKLLSFETPLRFIFSVWALQEGWDNPNIFTICKLAATAKDTSRRQQVGRGLRIAVNGAGSRLTYQKLQEKENSFQEINNLDVIVSGKEKEFIQQIQQEIQKASFSLVGDVLRLEDLKNLELNDMESALLFSCLLQNQMIDNEGKIKSSIYEFLKNNKEKLAMLNLTKERYQKILEIFTDNRNFVKDANKKIKQVKIRKNKWQEFKELWETINKKSKIVYKNIAEENIIETVAEEFDKEKIDSIKIKRFSQKYNAQTDQIENKEEENMGVVNFFTTQKFDDFLDHFVKKEKFPLKFMMELLNKIDKQKIKNNPKKAKECLLEILKDTLHGEILSSVHYEFLDTTIYPNDLQIDKEKAKTEIPYTLLGKDFVKDEKPQDHLLYDTICFDSEIEKTIQQKDSKEVNKNKVTVFAKLPKISIPTPYKNYNPDFAYLIEKEDGKKLFLVVESKGYNKENDIPKEEEKQKIEYAKKFFEALQDEFKKKFTNVNIQYTTRINRKTLGDLIKTIQ